MASLVLLDHEGGQIKQPSRSAMAAAAKLGEVHVLVAGEGVDAAAQAAAKLPGVAKVHVADSPAFAHALAEPLAALLAGLAGHHDHLFAASTATGKNVMPRVAALLDVQPVSDVSGIEGPDTFVRPIYAGNALATVVSSDAKKVITVRAASFDPVPAEGGSATVEAIPVQDLPGGARFVSAELSRSERPELTAARVVVSGGRALQSGENFHLLEKIAHRLGADVGEYDACAVEQPSRGTEAQEAEIVGCQADQRVGEGRTRPAIRVAGHRNCGTGGSSVQRRRGRVSACLSIQ